MSNGIRVAVSGTGGGAGQSLLKALAETDYEVVALDGEVLGTGLYASDTSYIIPYASSPDYIDTLLDIFQKENVSIFFPGLDIELPVLTKHTDKFRRAGVTVAVSSQDVIDLSDNKLLTYQTLTKAGVNVPDTYDMAVTPLNAIPLDYPFILKEREGGARSLNLHIIRNAEQLAGLVSHGVDISAYVAQEYIDGDEYTCGTINFDGECHGVIVMRRILRDGDTYKCFSVTDKVIEDAVRQTVTSIKPFGACNVQLRVRDGVPYIFEINARSSGTTGARALCGFNEPGMIADYITTGKKPTFTIKEQTVLRYWKELVVQNDAVTTMSEQRSLHQTEPTRL